MIMKTHKVGLPEIFETKVTKIKNRWHIRLIEISSGKVVDEMAVYNREDIGFAVFEMLRFADKNGWISPMAMASRERGNSKRMVPTGKVVYQGNLQ
jgi:hypothetical protein